MLHIYYARESIDKERYIYDSVAKQNGGSTLIIVPDQYTLEGEKQAFHFLEAESLLDVEVLSMSRLGSKLLNELGGSKKTFVDKYGRYMVLSQIAHKEASKLQVFKGTMQKKAFIQLVNNFISEIKQYNTSPEELREIVSEIPQGTLTRKKLDDLCLLYSRYEEQISGKYTDSEDYIDLYTSKIKQSKLIKNSNIWIYGFDSFAPKALDFIKNLTETAINVNVVLTYDDKGRDKEIFQLTSMVKDNLIVNSKAAGMDCEVRQIPDSFTFDQRSEAIKTIETQLFAVPKKTSKNFDGITLVAAANLYNEAESAASYILHLIRDKKLRYRDIVIICNDQKVRASILDRVFNEYGIDIFADEKRGILNSPIAILILSLVETIYGKYRTTDIFKALKTGLMDISEDEVERLENYTIKYKIRGTMWKKSFVKGEMEYGTQGLEEIEAIRKKVVDQLEKLENIYKNSSLVSEFILAYYNYITQDLCLERKIVELVKRQQDAGKLDLALETGQIWDSIMSIFDQIVLLEGDETFNGEDFITLLSEGLGDVEVGVLPPTVDNVIMGTMQRTRCSQVKAVLVVGANEGVLPMGPVDDGLFNSDELDFFEKKGNKICKVEEVKTWEEKLAIYRNLTMPSEYLWISFSTSDEEGKEIRPSEIIDNIKRIFPDIKVQKDVVNREKVTEIIGGRTNTLRHLTTALQEMKKGTEVDPSWKTVLEWYKEHDGEALIDISKGFDFENKPKRLKIEMVEGLYQKEKDSLSVSPSRLEKFSRCPFSHFVLYGLKPLERRIFQADGREIGDIYHMCLMKISEKLTREKLWDSITEEECRKMVSQITKSEMDNYREGLFSFNMEERYKTFRIEETCYHVCWALIDQVRQGEIKSSEFEVAFGRGKRIQPIETKVDGKKIYIEGKIDRVDILADDRVKIIDYKTGNEHFDADEAKSGYRLQLMIYLKAAMEKTKKPAGVFYFLVGEPKVDLTGIKKEDYLEKITKEIRKSFKLNGIMVNDQQVIQNIAGNFQGYSDIVPLRNSAGKEIKGTSEGFLLSEEEFAELQQDVEKTVVSLCNEMVNGKIDIIPKKSKDETPCKFCQYKGICRFDLGFDGCRYDIVKH